MHGVKENYIRHLPGIKSTEEKDTRAGKRDQERRFRVWLSWWSRIGRPVSLLTESRRKFTNNTVVSSPMGTRAALEVYTSFFRRKHLLNDYKKAQIVG